MFTKSSRFLCTSTTKKKKDATFLSQRKSYQLINNPNEIHKKRLAVLIDGDFLSVQTFFTKIDLIIKKSLLSDSQFSNNNKNEQHHIQQEKQQQMYYSCTSVLIHRIFSQQHPIRQEWQQVVLNRSESFESFKVQRFIPMHFQMVADAAHISQLRLSNRVQGIVFCTDLAAAPLFVQQLKKREEIFSYVDRYVVTEAGLVWKKEFAASGGISGSGQNTNDEYGEWNEKLMASKVVKEVLNF